MSMLYAHMYILILELSYSTNVAFMPYINAAVYCILYFATRFRVSIGRILVLCWL